MKRCKNIFLLILVSIITMLVMPSDVRGGEIKLGNGSNNTYKITEDMVYNVENEILIARYYDATHPNDGIGWQKAGNYYVRYDVTTLQIEKIDNKTLFQIQGWGVIKDYNNGKQGKYAPSYYLKLVDRSQNKPYYYRYDANKDDTQLKFNELNDVRDNTTTNGTCGHVDYDSGRTKYTRFYDNAEFAFDNINIDEIHQNHDYNAYDDLIIDAYMMIVIDGGGDKSKYGTECNKVRTDWFQLGIYDIVSGENKKVTNNSDYIIDTIDEVSFIAANAGAGHYDYNLFQNKGTINIGCNNRCDGDGNFRINNTYKIKSIKKLNSSGNWGAKFAYELYSTDADMTKTEDGWTISTWIQNANVPESFITIQRVEPERTCYNTTWDQLGDTEKANCCQDEFYLGTNKNLCCENHYLTGELERKICCDGNYAFKYIKTPGKEFACCKEVPETCCNNTNFVNTYWNDPDIGSTLSVYCCQKEQIIKTYQDNFYPFQPHKYTFNTFTEEMKNSKCYNAITPKGNSKSCKDGLSESKRPNTTVKINATNSSYTSGNFTFTTILEGNIVNNFNEQNIGYIITSSINLIDLTKLNVHIGDVNFNSSNNKLTINYSYDYNFEGYTDSVIPLEIEFNICYDINNSPPPDSSCDDISYRKKNAAKCCSLGYTGGIDCDDITSEPRNNLTCNNKKGCITPNKVQVYEINDSSGIAGIAKGEIIKCTEELQFKIADEQVSAQFLNKIINAGTGFKYDIHVIDKIVCSATYNFNKSQNKYKSLSAANSASHSIQTGFTNTINTIIGSNLNQKIKDNIDIVFKSNNKDYKYILNGNATKTTMSIKKDNYSTRIYFKCKDANGFPKPACHISPNLIRTASITVEYDLTLPKQYINRNDPTDLTTDDKSSDIKYIDGGNKFYTNISDSTGFHDFKIIINRGNLGGSNSIIKTGINANEFLCQYAVQNILTTGGEIVAKKVQENNGNTNYVTRPISLSQPFNDLSDPDRATNWKDASGSVNDKESKYITSTSTLIAEEPMYEFTLTPAGISMLQKYNRTNNYNTWNFGDKFEIKEIDNNITIRKSKLLNCIIDNNNSACNDIGDNDLKDVDGKINTSIKRINETGNEYIINNIRDTKRISTN